MILEGLREAAMLLWRLDAAVLDAAARSVFVSVLAVTAASIVGIALGLTLARKPIPGRKAWVLLLRLGMSAPTVLIGLLCYAALSRRGPLGEWELLYTIWAIVIGEFFLALPIVAVLTHGAIAGLDSRLAETAFTLGAGPLRRAWTYLNEARLAIALAILTAFSRCFTELGIAVMVGGNLPGRTRTLTTATALETARGEFARGLAMSLILLAIALLATAAIAWFSREDEAPA